MENYLCSMSALRDLITTHLHIIYRDGADDDYLMFEFARLIACVFEITCSEDFSIDCLIEVCDKFYKRSHSEEKSACEDK